MACAFTCDGMWRARARVRVCVCVCVCVVHCLPAHLDVFTRRLESDQDASRDVHLCVCVMLCVVICASVCVSAWLEGGCTSNTFYQTSICGGAGRLKERMHVRGRNACVSLRIRISLSLSLSLSVCVCVCVCVLSSGAIATTKHCP